LATLAAAAVHVAAAVLNGCNLLLAFFVLPESRRPTREKIDLAALNPLRPLRWVFSMKSLLPIVAIFFVFSATGEAYGTCWALWGSDASVERAVDRPFARRVRRLPDAGPGFSPRPCRRYSASAGRS
jgi:hypothetical protein